MSHFTFRITLSFFFFFLFFRFQEDEVSLIVQLLTSHPPPSSAGVRFVSLGLCMLIACPSLIGQQEHEKRSIEWVQWLVREEAYFERWLDLNNNILCQLQIEGPRMLHSQLEHHAGIAVQSIPPDLCFTMMFCAQHMFPFIYPITMLLTTEKKT